MNATYHLALLDARLRERDNEDRAARATYALEQHKLACRELLANLKRDWPARLRKTDAYRDHVKTLKGWAL